MLACLVCWYHDTLDTSVGVNVAVERRYEHYVRTTVPHIVYKTSLFCCCCFLGTYWGFKRILFSSCISEAWINVFFHASIIATVQLTLFSCVCLLFSHCFTIFKCILLHQIVFYGHNININIPSSCNCFKLHMSYMCHWHPTTRLFQDVFE
jgi:hypothetical protein